MRKRNYKHIFQLTNREKEFLALVAKGYNNTEIQNKLHISLGTLATHLHSIYSKIGLYKDCKGTSSVLRLRAAIYYWNNNGYCITKAESEG